MELLRRGASRREAVVARVRARCALRQGAGFGPACRLRASARSVCQGRIQPRHDHPITASSHPPRTPQRADHPWYSSLSPPPCVHADSAPPTRSHYHLRAAAGRPFSAFVNGVLNPTRTLCVLLSRIPREIRGSPADARRTRSPPIPDLLPRPHLFCLAACPTLDRRRPVPPSRPWPSPRRLTTTTSTTLLHPPSPLPPRLGQSRSGPHGITTARTRPTRLRARAASSLFSRRRRTTKGPAAAPTRG